MIILLSFFIHTPTAPTSTLSLHDALPISRSSHAADSPEVRAAGITAGGHDTSRSGGRGYLPRPRTDRKSTRLNSSHTVISYAVFCLKKKIFSHSCRCWRCQCLLPERNAIV